MSITIAATPDPTIEDRETIITEEIFLAKVIAEEQTELLTHASELIASIPPGRHGSDRYLSEYVTETYRRAHNNRTAIRHGWDTDVTIDRLSLFSWFNDHPEEWPQWTEEADADAVAKWNELIALGPDALRVRDNMRQSYQRVNNVSNVGKWNIGDTRELHGWYVSVQTGRRSEAGWVTGGRGATLHITPDPLATARRNVLPEATAFPAAAHAHTERGPLAVRDAVRFQMKSAAITLHLPPDLAASRRKWVFDTLRLAHSLKDRAARVSEEWNEWNSKTKSLREKRAKVAAFEEGLDGGFDPDDAQLRWVSGGAQIFKIALDTFGQSGLREMVVAEYLKTLDGGLTEAEQTLIDTEPKFGGPTATATLTEILKGEHLAELKAEF